MDMGDLADLMHQAARQVDPVVSRGMRTVAQVGVGHMKRAIQQVHAVDTGTMLNSVTADHQGNDSVLIGPTVQYAAYVALGTEHMPARPFHVQAARALKRDIKDIISAEDLGI